MNNFPKKLVMNGRLLLFTGKGKAPGAFVFTDTARGQVVELYQGEVLSQTAARSFIKITGNQVLQRLEAPRENHRIGDTVLAGPVVWSAAGPRALNTWTLEQAFFHKPARPQLTVGTFTEFKTDRGFGRLLTMGGESIFVHFSAFKAGVVPVVGVQYSFSKCRGAKGIMAQDVTVAA